MIKIRQTKSGVTVRFTGPDARRLSGLVIGDLKAAGVSAQQASALKWPAEPHRSLPNDSKSKSRATAAAPAFGAFTAQAPEPGAKG